MLYTPAWSPVFLSLVTIGSSFPRKPLFQPGASANCRRPWSPPRSATKASLHRPILSAGAVFLARPPRRTRVRLRRPHLREATAAFGLERFATGFLRFTDRDVGTGRIKSAGGEGSRPQHAMLERNLLLFLRSSLFLSGHKSHLLSSSFGHLYPRRSRPPRIRSHRL